MTEERESHAISIYHYHYDHRQLCYVRLRLQLQLHANVFNYLNVLVTFLFFRQQTNTFILHVDLSIKHGLVCVLSLPIWQLSRLHHRQQPANQRATSKFPRP